MVTYEPVTTHPEAVPPLPAILAPHLVSDMYVMREAAVPLLVVVKPPV